MGRFALQYDHGEDEYSDIDSSHNEGSPPLWNSDSYERQSGNFPSECPSRSSNPVLSTFHRALTRFHRGPLEEGEIPEEIDVIPQEDEDLYSQQQQQQQQLTRYDPHRPPYHLNPAAPIHYHIYYTPPSPQQHRHQQQQAQATTPWKWIALAAIISHITFVYGPSARTLHDSGMPPFAEWMANCWFAVSQVVWKSTFSYDRDWRLWRRDTNQKLVQEYDHSTPKMANCVVDVDQWPLFGQPMVFDLMKEALDSPPSKFNLQRPLIFYAVGGPGVGKRYMAHLLAQSCSGSSLLEVDLSTVHVEDDLITLLRNHLVSMDDGRNVKNPPSVILLSHVSKDNASPVETILQRLGTLFHEFPDWWRNVILVLTSRSGATTIDKAIRHYGKDSLPVSQLVTYLRQSLFQFHPAVASAVILPFVPLDRSSVQAMVQTLLPMKIGLDDLNYLLDSTLEWETWIDRQSQLELYTFLPKGGHDVTLLIQQLLPPDSCGGGENLEQDSTWLQVKNANQLYLASCVNGDSQCYPICQYPLV